MGDTPIPPAPGTPAWIEAQLQSRLGPGARLGAIAFEGRLIHVRGASLPLGRRASLRVAHAVVELGAGLPLGELPLSLRLVSLRCEVHLGDGAQGGTFPVQFTADEGAPAAWVHGTLRLGGDAWIASTLSVRPSGFRLDGQGHDGKARLRGWGRLPLAPPSAEAAGVPLLALQVEGADAALLASLGGASKIRLPPDLTLTGELAVSAERAVSGTFALETPRSALLFSLSLGETGVLLGSTLRGRFTAADAAAVGLSGGPARPRPDDVLTLDARLTGTLARPGIAGRLAAARLSLQIGREEARAPVVLEVEDASVLLDVGPEGFAWHQLTGRFYGGRFTSSGRLGRATGALGATIAWSGVLLDALPARASGEPALGALLAGKGSGELRFDRESRAEHALGARGHVIVSEPIYHFVRRFAPALARYGLPTVSRRGMGPLVAEVRLERGEIIVAPVAATLDGIEVEGELRVREGGGHLLGQVHVHLLEGYLSRSPLLALPAALSGRVTIPVYCAGPPGKLDVQTDALEILDGLLAGSRVGEAVKTALDGLRGAARARWGGSPGRGPRRR